MRPKLLPAAGLVFGSGLCALIYQTTWLREFRLIFGSSTAATAAVLAIFMGGLGAGSVFLSRRAENSPCPLGFYARLELLIAASAALTSILIPVVRFIYISSGGTLVMGAVLATCLRLLLATLVLIVPTFLMGGTLPAMARFAVSDHDTGRRGLALLYGANTLGAVTGVGLGCFFLLERFGNHITLWLACLLNASVACAGWLLARREKPLAKNPVTWPSKLLEAAAPFHFVLFAATTTGFVFLLMELVWYRMLSPLLGGTAFTFGLILAVALFGIGLGSALYSLGAGERRPTLNGFACICALESLCLAVPFALGDRLALASMLMHPLGTLGFYGRVAGWIVLCSVIVLPAAIMAGIQFPMLLGLLGKGRNQISVQTGTVYAWNTAGAIGGSLAGGFGLIPIFTAPGAWKLVVIALAACGFAATIVAHTKIRNPLRAAPTFLIGMSAISLILFATGPTAAWRHSPIGLGILEQYQSTPNRLHDLLNAARRDILWDADGSEVSVGVSKSNSLAFVVNGKCDGSTRGDAGTQVMSGLLAALTHPHPQSAAVVGLGTGSTAGWLAAVPSIEHVDVMEIEPAIVKFAKLCAPVNQDALNNPKLHLFLGDARELLLTNEKKYDLMVSEPSNPYRAGIATLFTKEYYQAVAKRLNPGGLFAQWMQIYDVDSRTVQIFYATFSSVFPYIETWQTQDGDLLLIGSLTPITYDVPGLRERITQEPFATALNQVWWSSDLEGLFSHYLGNEKFAQVMKRSPDAPINTDDRTLLEFAFARNMRMNGGVGGDRLRQDALAFEADRPACYGELDWEKVEDLRFEMFVPFETVMRVRNEMPAERQVLAEAFKNYIADNLAGAWQRWNQLQREPRSRAELTMVAECLADQGDARAFDYIERLKEIAPTDAKAIEARLLWRQDRIDEAGALLEKVCLAFHSDPWPLRPLMDRTLALSWKVAQRDKTQEIARTLYRAIEKPFAIYNVDQSRMMAVLRLGTEIDHGRVGECVLRAIEAAEPNVPWQFNFLKARSAGYAYFHHPLEATAKRDLDQYIAADPDLSEKTDSPIIDQRNRVASTANHR